MSHSLSQQVSDLKRQLAEQRAECDAIRAECEEWKVRAERESQEKAMLEAILKDAEKGKVEWWTKFKELQASGSAGSPTRRRKRADDEERPDDRHLAEQEVDDDIVSASESFSNPLAQFSELVEDEGDEEMAGAGVQAVDFAESLPTAPEEPAKPEEEEVRFLSVDPIQIKVDEREEDEEVQYLSGAFPTTLGDIKIKVEPGAFELPLDTVQARFRQADAKSLGIEFDSEFHAKAVTRAFLTSKYGGNSNTTWCPVAEATRRRKGHDIQVYFCPGISWSPNLPRAPGLPGLFNVPRAGLEVKEMPLFVGLNVNKWVYMGHYTGVPQGPLSNEEIESLGEKALNAWVEDVLGKGWAKTIRARVYLRLQGIEPTKDEIERILSRRAVGQVTARDIRTAYERREEIMHVVCLKPVRYDREFQQQLIDDFRAYEKKIKRKQITAKAAGNRVQRSNNSPNRGSSPAPTSVKIQAGKGKQDDSVVHNAETRRSKRARHYSPEV